MLDVGRVCLKTAGREAGKVCCVVKKIDSQFVLITGPRELTRVKRRKCNITHLEPLEDMLSIKSDAPDSDVLKAFQSSEVMKKLNLQAPSAEDIKRVQEQRKEKEAAKKAREEKERKEREALEKKRKEEERKKKEAAEKAKKQEKKKSEKTKEAPQEAVKGEERPGTKDVKEPPKEEKPKPKEETKAKPEAPKEDKK